MLSAGIVRIRSAGHGTEYAQPGKTEPVLADSVAGRDWPRDFPVLCSKDSLRVQCYFLFFWKQK